MAFYKDIEDVKAPDWTGASKEPNRKPVDTSMEKLLSGLADTLGGAVDMFDRTQNEQIKNETRQVMEGAVNNEYDRLGTMLPQDQATTDVSPESARGIGGEAARDANPTVDLASTEDGEELPEDAKATLDQAGNLAQAAGLKPQLVGHYYNDLYAKAGMLRNRYPGKVDLIDKYVSHITGVNPANARLRARQAEVAANLTAQQKQLASYQKEFTGDDGPYIQAVTGGVTQQQYIANRDVIMQKAQMLKGQNLMADAKIKEMENNTKLGGLEAMEAVKSRFAVDDSVFINGALSKLQQRGLEIQAKGKNATPDEIQELQTSASVAIQQMEQSRLKYLNAVRTDKNGKAFTIAQRLGPDAANKVVEDSMKMYKQWAELYSNTNQNGVANAATNWVKNQHAINVRKAMELFPGVNMMDGFHGANSDVLMAPFIEQNKAIQNDLQRAAQDATIVGIFSSKVGDLPSLNKIAPSATDSSGQKNPEAGKQTKLLINQLTTAIKTGSPDQAIKAATVLYKDSDFLLSLPLGQRKQAWALLTDPSFATVLADKPEVLRQHMEWVAKTLPAIAKTDIDTIQKDVIEFNRVEVQFQPDTMNFAFKLKDGQIGIGGSGFDEGPTGYKRTVTDEASRAVANINDQINRVKPVFEKLYGDQAPQKLMEVLQGKGLDMNADKKGYWLEEAAKSVGEAVSGAAGAVKEKVKSVLPDTSPTPKTPAFRDKQSGLVHENQAMLASTRTQPLRKEVASVMERAAKAAGVQVEVYSGGQPSHGSHRTGSHRHDGGGAGDVRLFTTGENGEKKYVSSNTAEGRRIISQFITESVKNGANGVGHGPGYMGDTGIHVGGGSPSVWGAKGSSKTAPKWVKDAYEKGIVERHYQRHSELEGDDNPFA